MKRILFLAFLLISVVGLSQPYVNFGSPYGNNMAAVNAYRAFQVPRGTDTTTNVRPDTVGMLFFKTTDETFWLRVKANNAGVNKWTQITTTGTPFVQTWQATLNVTNGNVLTQNNTVQGGNYAWVFDSALSYRVNQYRTVSGDLYSSYLSLNTGSVTLNSARSGSVNTSSNIIMSGGSIVNTATSAYAVNSPIFRWQSATAGAITDSFLMINGATGNFGYLNTSNFVPSTRTVNGLALSSNINLGLKRTTDVDAYTDLVGTDMLYVTPTYGTEAYIRYNNNVAMPTGNASSIQMGNFRSGKDLFTQYGGKTIFLNGDSLGVNNSRFYFPATGGVLATSADLANETLATVTGRGNSTDSIIKVGGVKLFDIANNTYTTIQANDDQIQIIGIGGSNSTKSLVFNNTATSLQYDFPIISGIIPLSVNSQTANSSGAITLTAANVGALGTADSLTSIRSNFTSIGRAYKIADSLATGFLRLTGGTLTGALTGTTASFTGAINSNTLTASRIPYIGTNGALRTNSLLAYDSATGRILVGTTSSRNVGGAARLFQIEGTASNPPGISIVRNSADAGGPVAYLGKSRNAAIGGNTIVQNGDVLGIFGFVGSDGSNLDNFGASIVAVVNGTPASGFIPAQLDFRTTSSGSTPTTRMTITSQGSIDIWGTTTTAGTTGAVTINKPTGTVNFAAGATAITVTNSLVTTGSYVFATIRTNDATALIKNVVPASGSFTINLNAAATAETSVAFYVINPL